jgi:hypothetical protein
VLCEQLLLRPGSVVAVTAERVTDAFALPHTAPGAAAGGSAEGGVLYLVTRLRIVKLSREVALAGDAALASRLAEVRRGVAAFAAHEAPSGALLYSSFAPPPPYRPLLPFPDAVVPRRRRRGCHRARGRGSGGACRARLCAACAEPARPL